MKPPFILFMENIIICGDCKDVLTGIPDGTINLIVTSPPYADSRKNTYGGIKPDDYVNWFLERSSHFYRVLRADGTFILNIKEKVVDGERHTYVFDLIKALKKQNWLWTEEFIWHKRNCFPGKWPNRFRDAWERCLQFNKNKKFRMFQDAVKVPIGDWSKKRLSNLSETDKIRDASKVESGFGKKVANWVGKETVYPTNVLHLSTECSNRSHSAVFPLELPSWFIKLFTEENDLVLDPFVGSGTTAVTCVLLNRRYIGIDNLPENCKIATERLKDIT